MQVSLTLKCLFKAVFGNPDYLIIRIALVLIDLDYHDTTVCINNFIGRGITHFKPCKTLMMRSCTVYGRQE